MHHALAHNGTGAAEVDAHLGGIDSGTANGAVRVNIPTGVLADYNKLIKFKDKPTELCVRNELINIARTSN